MAKRKLRIKYVGKTIPAPPFIIDGNAQIMLPADQSKPFAHVEARRILQVMPELYKPVISKGR